MREQSAHIHEARPAERRLAVSVRGAPGAHLFVRAGGQGPREHIPALVVCPGFIQNRRAFELPSRSLLDHLVGAGFDVYALEFAKHERHRHEGLSHYADRVAPLVLDVVRSRHHSVAWVGHSMGGLVGAALPPHETSRLSALVTIGSPLKPGIGLKQTRALEVAIATAGRRFVRRGTSFRGAQLATLFRLGAIAFDHPRARFPLQVWAPGHLRRDELLWSLSNAFVEDSWAALADMLDLTHSDG
ncbi:MAG: alpha/beta fold hydrolase, partial [Myxococcota bacterium]